MDDYEVVINIYSQYSIWRADDMDRLPDGWRPAGCRGTKEECLAYVDEHWTDITPKPATEGEQQSVS